MEGAAVVVVTLDGATVCGGDTVLLFGGEMVVPGERVVAGGTVDGAAVGAVVDDAAVVVESTVAVGAAVVAGGAGVVVGAAVNALSIGATVKPYGSVGALRAAKTAANSGDMARQNTILSPPLAQEFTSRQNGNPVLDALTAANSTSNHPKPCGQCEPKYTVTRRLHASMAAAANVHG